MGSNGLTSARHDVLCHEYAPLYPEAFDPAVPKELVFSGKYKLTEIEPESGVEVGRLVLSPTRTCVPKASPASFAAFLLRSDLLATTAVVFACVCIGCSISACTSIIYPP
jgi:hypothetical protein